MMKQLQGMQLSYLGMPPEPPDIPLSWKISLAAPTPTEGIRCCLHPHTSQSILGFVSPERIFRKEGRRVVDPFAEDPGDK